MKIPRPLARLFVTMYTVLQLAQPLTANGQDSTPKGDNSNKKNLSDLLHEAEKDGHNSVIVKTNKSYHQLAKEGYFSVADTTYNKEIIVVAKLLEELNIQNQGDSLGGRNVGLFKPSKKEYLVLLPVNFDDFGLDYSPPNRPPMYRLHMRNK